ncbi:hypothetical protein LEP1GSC123_3493 [Leptospira borgpetersenii str. 200701203]|uniref:Uncharacterized protein n=1 Tax=Leptospira borgpetersenii str. 200701203 TaxID=1193007 RepID=M3HLI8_LEPBO|nr:hypothetical protein LEP1GSC123_3493 [Leptospira borgpetersenii str. 200701203]
MLAKAGFVQTFLQRVPKTAEAILRKRYFSFLFYQKDQAGN